MHYSGAVAVVTKLLHCSLRGLPMQLLQCVRLILKTSGSLQHHARLPHNVCLLVRPQVVNNL